MGHFGTMADIRDIGGRETSGSNGIYDEELTRPIPPMSNLTLGPSTAGHFSGAAASTAHSMHGITNNQGTSSVEESLNEPERLTLKTDKDAIYS